MQSPPSETALYQQLRNRCVQNLAWCLLSPSLIDKTEEHGSHTLAQSQKLVDQIRALDDAPSELMQWLASSPSPRLGLMFERFWQFWWRRHTDLSQWLFNQQINKGGRTLGELDALQWQPDTRTLIHYELAVKFYLQVPTSTLGLDRGEEPEDCWVGPNLNDRLDLKWPQMRDRQLTVLYDVHRRPDLPWNPDTIITRSLTRGRLFRPHRAFSHLHGISLDNSLNPAHDHGQWIHLNDWHHLDGAHWKLLARQEWFAPLNGMIHEQPVSLSNEQASQALHRHFACTNQPVQLIEIECESERWHERERWFVVPPDWPNQRQ